MLPCTPPESTIEGTTCGAPPLTRTSRLVIGNPLSWAIGAKGLWPNCRYPWLWLMSTPLLKGAGNAWIGVVVLGPVAFGPTPQTPAAPSEAKLDWNVNPF